MTGICTWLLTAGGIFTCGKSNAKKYDSGWFAGKTWEDDIAYEMFHLMLY